MSPDHAALEAEIGALFAGGDARRAVEAAFRGYGPEILGYLVSLTGSSADAEDLAADLYVRLLASAERYEHRGTFRAFAYRVARNLVLDRLRSPSRRARRLLTDEEARLVAQARESTDVWLRSDAHGALERVRERLDESERSLLTLRVDRAMSWDEVAIVLSGDGEPVATATLRKRFQALKAKLRKLLQAEGVLRPR